MNIKQFNTNNIENIKKLSPNIYNKTLEVSIPFFVLHKTLFEKGEKIISKDFNLTQSELDILSALYYIGGENFTLTPTKLNEVMLFSSGGITKLLNKLEEKNYIKRIISDEDKRSRFVQITQLGKEIMKEALKTITSFENKYFSKLNNKELEEFKTLLYKILD